jgi:solute carrier family 25 uncoupling protein 8/9
VGPNIIRNSIINAAEIATFDQAKDMILRAKLMEDGNLCNLVCSSIAGFTACIVGSPVDVLKTRIMNARTGEYSGVLDCIRKTLKEGPFAFYKGIRANANRLVSWNIVMFVTLCSIRKDIYERYYKE